MDQQQLIDRLDARVADIAVGPPPTAEMRTCVRRRRGRRTVLAAAAAVAVIVAVSAGWQLADDGVGSPSVATEVPADPDAPPAGHRYVGIGSAVIAVPETWSTNEAACGMPQADTVLIDQGVICGAFVPLLEGVDSLEVRRGVLNARYARWAERDVDGEATYWSPVDTEGEVASASVAVPEQDVVFTARSSSPGAARVVSDLLATLTILHEHTTVPGFEDLDYDPAPAIEGYTARLGELGLKVEVVEQGSDLSRGTVLATDPAVGSVVAPGTTVRVTVSG